jgi:hypothetical protein
VTIIPVERPAVERMPVIVLEAVTVVPLLSVKVSGSALAAAKTGEGASVTTPAAIFDMVVPDGIPVPMTVVPTFSLAKVAAGIPVIVSGIPVVPESVAVMVWALPTAVIVSETPGEVDVAVALADKVMSVPFTMDAIVVAGGIPGPLISIPAASLSVEGRVTVGELSVVAPVIVLLLLAFMNPSKVKTFAPVSVGTFEMVISVPLFMAVMVVLGGMPFPVTIIPR